MDSGILIRMAYLSWLWVHGELVWIMALVLALGLGLWQGLGTPRRRGQRYRWQQLMRLPYIPPGRGRARWMVRHVQDLVDGEVQFLIGRVRAAGTPCESYDRGDPVAASTIECPLDASGRAAHGRGAVSLRRRADRLALALEGGTVSLEGDVEVLVGSRQAHPRQRLHGLPPSLCERVYRDRPASIEPGSLLREPPVIRNLAAGDTVVVAGRVLADGAAGSDRAHTGAPYRAAAPQRWILHPVDASADRPAITAVSREPLSVPTSPILRFGVLPLVWAAGALAVLAAVGTLSLRVAAKSELTRVPGDGADVVHLSHDRLPVRAPALAVAAATPFHRERALGLLAGALAHSRERGHAITEARVAVAHLRGRCAEAASVLREHQQPELALAVAERCAASASDEADEALRVAGLAWMDLGHYERASAAFAAIAGAGDAPAPADHGEPPARDLPPARNLSDVAVAHVLAGAWPQAAATLRRMAEGRDLDTERMTGYACLAEAAAARAGDAEAREVLAIRARSFRSPACALLVADLSDGAERSDWLHYARVPWGSLATSSRGRAILYLRELLAREPGARAGRQDRTGDAGRSRGPLLAAGVPGDDTPYETVPALESAVLERLQTSPGLTDRDRVLRMAMAARAAGLAAHLGQHRRAAELRAAVMADAEGLAADAGDTSPAWRTLRGDALLLAAVTHWRAGDLAAASEALARARDLAAPALLERVESVLALETHGELRAPLASVLTGHSTSHAATGTAEDKVLALARTGDGATLAAMVEEERVIPNAIGMLAPSLSTGRDRLLEHLRWGRRDAGVSSSVATALWHDGARAFAAERLGDQALARRVREIADRRYQALARRDAAVLVYLIEHL